ncbi:hypothetical protein BC826DRAFT_90460 [Russula brevipes]|nr:hypothetical protein BC826DRAFT_90460 [Russula brevipes]
MTCYACQSTTTPTATPSPPRRHSSRSQMRGGVFDDAWPPRNPRHPLALATAWGVYTTSSECPPDALALAPTYPAMSNQEAACYTGPHPRHADSPSRSQTRGGCIRRRPAATPPPPRRHPSRSQTRGGVYSTTPGRRATPDTPPRSQLRGGCIRRRPAATPPPPRRHPSRSQTRGGWGLYDDAWPPRSPRHRCSIPPRKCMG